MMRPGVRGIHRRLDRIERELATDRLDRAKYEAELDYWRWLVLRGGSEHQHGEPFEAVFGRWQRHRLLKLSHWLLLPGDDSPGNIDDWCATRSVVEIGAGPYPAAAAARKGWMRCVAVDPLAKGYSQEGLVPHIADRVVYIEAPGERIPLPAGFADLVINENCLDHVSDPGAVVAEMLRLLKPGGLAWFFVDLSRHRDHMHPHPMGERRVMELFREFELVNSEVTTHKAHPEADGSIRALFRKPGHPRERLQGAQGLGMAEFDRAGSNGSVRQDHPLEEGQAGAANGRANGTRGVAQVSGSAR